MSKKRSYKVINIKRGNDLNYNPHSKRNYTEKILTIISGLFALLSVLPLIFVLAYVIIEGFPQLGISLFTQLPEPPGDDLLSPGGIGNAIIGTLIVSLLGALIAIPIGVGGGIFLAEYSMGGTFSRFMRFGTNVLAGVPSIIAGVFIYGIIVSTKLLFNSTYSALAGAIALSILMLPTIIKTTDEGLKLVPDELRRGALSLGASKFITITKITLPAAFSPIATGILLAIARAAGETAPLIFTALFSFYWPEGNQALLEPIASLSVLIFNFSLEPYEAQNQLAWSASFVLLAGLLVLNIFAKALAHLTTKYQNK